MSVLDVWGIGTIRAGMNHSMASQTAGSVAAWGWNQYGQLGDGPTTSRNTPVAAACHRSLADFSGGGGHTLAARIGGLFDGGSFSSMKKVVVMSGFSPEGRRPGRLPGGLPGGPPR